jgi:hypothetical protein
MRRVMETNRALLLSGLNSIYTAVTEFTLKKAWAMVLHASFSRRQSSELCL